MTYASAPHAFASDDVREDAPLVNVLQVVAINAVCFGTVLTGCLMVGHSVWFALLQASFVGAFLTIGVLMTIYIFAAAFDRGEDEDADASDRRALIAAWTKDAEDDQDDAMRMFASVARAQKEPYRSVRF